MNYKKRHKNENFEEFKERRMECNKRRRIREKDKAGSIK